MVLPHYFCESEEDYQNRNFNWETIQMKSLYQVLDTAQELGVYVNLTMWGVDTRYSPWLAVMDSGLWCSEPKEGMEPILADLFATLVKYLREERGYTCVQEVTMYNEPNGIYKR